MFEYYEDKKCFAYLIAEKKLFVSNSHVKKIVWYIFDKWKICMIRLKVCDAPPTLLMVRSLLHICKLIWSPSCVSLLTDRYLKFDWREIFMKQSVGKCK